MRALGTVLMVVVGVALAASTAARVHLWTDGERLLWADAVRKAPEKPRPWINLGNQYAASGLVNIAEDAYQQATALAENPRRLREERTYGFALAQANLAQLQAARGDLPGALMRVRAVTARYQVTSVLELQAWYERQLTTP